MEKPPPFPRLPPVVSFVVGRQKPKKSVKGFFFSRYKEGSNLDRNTRAWFFLGGET